MGDEAVQILPGNRAMWELISLLPNQWEVGFGGPYALKLSSFIETARCLGVRTDQVFFEKLAVYEREALRVMKERQEKKSCDKEQKARCAFEHGEFLEWACSQCERKADG